MPSRRCFGRRGRLPWPRPGPRTPSFGLPPQPTKQRPGEATEPQGNRQSERDDQEAPSKKLPSELKEALTCGRGKELMNDRQFSLATDIDVYFCDPRNPWQRDSNENTNGLLRQYFPIRCRCRTR